MEYESFKINTISLDKSVLKVQYKLRHTNHCSTNSRPRLSNTDRCQNLAAVEYDCS